MPGTERRSGILRNSNKIMISLTANCVTAIYRGVQIKVFLRALRDPGTTLATLDSDL